MRIFSLLRPHPAMLCGYTSRATGLLCACIVMMGSMGLPVDNRRNLWTVPQQKNPALSEFKVKKIIQSTEAKCLLKQVL